MEIIKKKNESVKLYFYSTQDYQKTILRKTNIYFDTFKEFFCKLNKHEHNSFLISEKSSKKKKFKKKMRKKSAKRPPPSFLKIRPKGGGLE